MLNSRVRIVVLLIGLPGLFACDKVFGLAAAPDAVEVTTDAFTPLGCADLTREGFGNAENFPNIAGCAGAWGLGGLRPALAAQCGRAAGNTGTDRAGTLCTAADLCAEGWHVCLSRLDARANLPPQIATCEDVQAVPEMFFATGQAGSGAGECNDFGDNDVFGCGTYGYRISGTTTCDPLKRFSGNNCDALAVGGWSCSNPESQNIKKSDPMVGGGVLCCRD